MRLSDDTWRCNNCGADFEVPADVQGIVEFVPNPGERPIRTLVFEGEELHRCIAKPTTYRFGGRPRKSAME
ncbi:MAG TPA: hypothetical protein VNC41_12105 [Acidimicrobiia bacterium]|nr:hypothetical protein [Acidimicrobiia bacterium]